MTPDERRGLAQHYTVTSAMAARWMFQTIGGKTRTDMVLAYINSGELKAINVAVDLTGRATYHIAYRDLVKFLRARHWSRIPSSPAEFFATVGRRRSDPTA